MEMEEDAAMPVMGAVNAATGALGPVLAKLTALLADEHSKLPEGISRSDAESIRSDLQRVHSTLLPWIWGMVGDVDAAWKDDLMAEVREMSYDVEDAIDDLELSLEATDDGDTAAASLEELKTKVKNVSDQFIGKWRPLVEQITEESPPPSPSIDDHRARLFLHEDAAADQLVGMEEHIDELIKLLEQGADSSRDASRWRKGRRHLAISNEEPKLKLVIKVLMTSRRDRLLAMEAVAKIDGVISISVPGPPGSNHDHTLEVIGQGIDPVAMIATLRRKMGHAALVQVGRMEPTRATRPTAVSAAVGGFHEVETVCILGFAGGGKTTLAKRLYNLATTEQQFEYRAFMSVSPGRIPNRTEILREILRGEPTPPSAGNDIASEQEDLIHRATSFLVGKRYIIVIDDIWHWEAWEIIRKILPKNNLGSRIIVTTRLNSVAEKFLEDDGNDAFVYEIGALYSVDALRLSEKIVKKSLGENITSIFGTVMDNPCRHLVDMCYGMPLALICMSSALAEEIQKQLGSGEIQKWKALRSVEEGILDIPSLMPLGESLSLDYNHLPLNLRTLLFYCSSVYHRGDEIERGRLVRMWIVEGFVSKEKAARDYFDQLVDSGWIKQTEDFGDYEIHPVMLAFLRCKAHKYNFVTCLGLGSDVPSSPMTIRRLSLHRGHPLDCFSRNMDASSTRTLVVLGRVTGVPFHRFQRLRVLHLEDNEDDMHGSLLEELCEKLSSLRLRYLGLKGTRITKLPWNIRKLKHLEVLYAGRTQTSELPPEIGELQHLHILDLTNTQIRELPPQIGKLKHLLTLDLSNTPISELSLQIGELERLLTLDLSNTPISELPPQIGDLKHVHTLNLRNTQIRKLPPQIGKLKHLHTLDLRNTMVRELPWQSGQIAKSLRVLAGDVQVELPEGVSQALSNDIADNSRTKCREFLCIAILDRFDFEPRHVGIFKVPDIHVRIPDLIKQHFGVLSCLDIRLCKLEPDDHRYLAEMPNLRTLVLRLEALPRNVLHVNGMGFAALESFRVDSRMPWITFEEGAMPKLKHLEFKFYSGQPSNHPVGITHLLSLQKVVFRCSKFYKIDGQGISTTIRDVVEEAKKHPNRIILCINVEGRKEIFIEVRKSSQNIASRVAAAGRVGS